MPKLSKIRVCCPLGRLSWNAPIGNCPPEYKRFMKLFRIYNPEMCLITRIFFLHDLKLFFVFTMVNI